ncbi:hypothetical protein CL622_07395 [archaeon]|nr:hypothetical protein [archaeon]
MTLSSSQLNEAISVAHRLIANELASSFAKANYFYQVVTKAPLLKAGSGTKIQIPVQLATNKASGFFSGEYDTVPTNANQQITYAEFDWKFYMSNSTFNLKDFATGTGSAAVKDLIKTKIALAKQDAIRELSEALHTSSATDANSINSLKDAAGAAGTAYGGLSDTDLPEWLFERDTTTATINYANINNVFRVLMGRGQGVGDETGTYTPDLMLSNSYTLSRFLSSQQSQQQFSTEKSLKSGFSGCLFNGVDWVVDEYCTGSGDGVTADNELYILSTNTFRMFHKYGFSGSQSPMDTLNMRMPNQAAISSQTYLVMNLVAIARRYSAVFTALTS